MRTASVLMARYAGEPTLPTVMMCGTSAIGAIRPVEMELEDPVLGRTLRHGYRVEALPVVS